MPILTPSLALFIGFIVTPSLFILSAYLTHANRRHILGAVVGASLYAVVNYVWDRAAAAFGWWTYPAWKASGQLPLAVYLLAGIVGGGAFDLVGWRIIRRWNWKGFAGFLLFWAVYAVVHDYGGSLLFASSGLMLFGAGPVPITADVLFGGELAHIRPNFHDYRLRQGYPKTIHHVQVQAADAFEMLAMSTRR